MQRKPYPAKVVWHDACGGKTGWYETAEAGKYVPYVVESYGWLVKKDRDHVTLALSKHIHKTGTVSYADTLDVPMGMVKRVKRLR